MAIRSALIVLAVALTACGGDGSDDGPLGLAGVELSNPTERPEFVLTDTGGQPYAFHERTAGELTLMYFGYTECPDICPVHLAQLSEALDRPGMPDAKVVFVSVDPARDTPEVIRSWLDGFDEDFVGLTGSVDDLVAAQEAAGVVPADIEGDPEEAGYLVGHAGQLLAYAPDDRGYVIYPFGTRQSELVNDLPVLAEFTAESAE
ncbi:MAG: SCO family protein [Actinomycetota bacterium]